MLVVMLSLSQPTIDNDKRQEATATGSRQSREPRTGRAESRGIYLPRCAALPGAP
jgi:hypothetical protein